MTTFWKNAERFPPILVRLLARHKYGKPLSALEISEASLGSVTPAQVEAISQCTQWGSIRMVEAAGFMRGCGLDLCNRQQLKKAEAYLRKNPNFRYLRESQDWEAYYKPMMTRWASSPEAERETWAPIFLLRKRIKLASRQP